MIDRAKDRDEVAGLLSDEWPAEGTGSLSPREEKVLRMLYGVGISDPVATPIREVGVYFGVTGARIRQVEIAALSKLREVDG